MNRSGTGAAWKADGSAIADWVSSTPSPAMKDAKIVWFSLRTGCSKEEAKKWLITAKWKIDKAIVLRDAQIKRDFNLERESNNTPDQNEKRQ